MLLRMKRRTNDHRLVAILALLLPTLAQAASVATPIVACKAEADSKKVFELFREGWPISVRSPRGRRAMRPQERCRPPRRGRAAEIDSFARPADGRVARRSRRLETRRIASFEMASLGICFGRTLLPVEEAFPRMIGRSGRMRRIWSASCQSWHRAVCDHEIDPRLRPDYIKRRRLRCSSDTLRTQPAAFLKDIKDQSHAYSAPPLSTAVGSQIRAIHRQELA